MLRRRLVFLPLLTATLLAGCAATVDSASTASPTPSLEPVSSSPEPEAPQAIDPATMPPIDPVGQERAQTWLAEIPMPPDAVALDARPDDSRAFDLQQQGWWCAPMGFETGYWQVPGMDLIETSNWIGENPGPGLVSTSSGLEPGANVDNATLGHVPSLDALEGIAFSMIPANGGTFVRAEVGAFGGNTVCPTAPPGAGLGGPGQG